MLVQPLLSALVLAADGASGSGGKDAGESASTWDVGGFAFWLLIVLIAVGVLVGVLLLAGAAGRLRRHRPAPTRRPAPPPGAPVARRVQQVEPAEGGSWRC